MPPQGSLLLTCASAAKSQRMKLIPCVLAMLALSLSVTAEAQKLYTRDGQSYPVDRKVDELVTKARAAEMRGDKSQMMAALTAAIDTKPEPQVAAALYDIRAGYDVDDGNVAAGLRGANEAIRLNPRL